MKTIDVEDKRVRVQIWDTAGQDRFRTITQTFYRGAMGIILTYAVNDRESFENVESWMKQIEEHASEDVCKILVGNKSDMDNRCVDYEEGKKLADSYGIQFFETSARDGRNVNDVFHEISREIKSKANLKNGPPTGGDKLKLQDEKTVKNSNCC